MTVVAGIYLICVDEKDKPEAIQPKNWVKEGRIYTPKYLFKDLVTGKISFSLEEITPDTPYKAYLGSRFRLFPFSQN